jgi:hypothetical protein
MWRVLRSELPSRPAIWGDSKEDARARRREATPGTAGVPPAFQLRFYRRYSMYRAVSSATSRPKRVSTM